MSDLEAANKLRLFESAGQYIGSGALTRSLHAQFLPGRIEVFGKHTDYAGGRSLLCAAERGLCFVCASRDDERVIVRDAVTREQVETQLSADATFEGPDWANYVVTVVRRLSRNFPAARQGASVAFASDLPRAAGMSSSSALVTGLFLALVAANELERSERWRANIATREDLATYLGCVENGAGYRELSGDRGVGTFGGSEDHTAMLASQADRLKQFAFCPTRLERTIDLPRSLCFAIAVSGVVANKTGAAMAAYNRASLATRRILDLWTAQQAVLAGESRVERTTSNTGVPATLAEACGAFPGAPATIVAALEASTDPTFPPQSLRERLDQFVEESFELVPRAAEALGARDLDRFGALAARSQVLAETLLRNQVPETTWLAHAGREQGAYAASAFGAGFGGSVWALVERGEADAFVSRWQQAYRKIFPHTAERAVFFPTGAGPGAISLQIE
jgi:galactokinase